MTALLALRSLGLEAGMSLAVTGGAGALGGYVIQLARHLGLEVIADAAASDVALLRELGAQRVIERGGDHARAIRSVEPDGVDGLVDAAAIGESLLPAIRDGGQLAAVRPMDVVPERGVSLHHIWVPGHARDAESLAEVADLASRGVFTPRVAAVMPPEAAPEAHRRLAAGGTRGRLVLDFGS